MTTSKLNRRTVLRGILGGSLATVALPTLDAMLNDSGTAFADGEELPCRFMTYYWADGIVIDQFEPTAVGPGWQNQALPPALQPLAPVKEYITLCTGLRNLSPNQITHHEGMAMFNGYPFVNAQGLNSDAGGPTIDQVIADRLEQFTTVRSVQVQISKEVSTDGDGGTTSIALSHRGTPGNLIAQTPQVNPQIVWESLFGNFAEPVDTSGPRIRVLDAVKGDVDRLKKKLGTKDKQRLDAHLTAVDEIQKKITAVGPSCQLPAMPTETNTNTGGTEPISSVTSAMAQMIAYAFACDLTRVASVMFKRYVSSTVFDEIGAGNIHHSSSHNGPSDPTYQAGVVYQMQKLSDLLQVLKATPDGPEQNLLDSTILYASTDCSTGAAHAIDRQPIILAGTGRGYLNGTHYQATTWNGSHNNPNGAGNASDVLLTCLQRFDPSATSVGGGACQSSSPLTEILA